MLGPVDPTRTSAPLRGAINSVKSQAPEKFLQLKMFALGRADYEGKTLKGKMISKETGQTFALRNDKDLQPVRDRLQIAIKAGDQAATLTIADKLGKGLLLLKGYKTRDDIPRFFRELGGRLKAREISQNDLPFILNHIKGSYSEFAKDVESVWNKKQS